MTQLDTLQLDDLREMLPRAMVEIVDVVGWKAALKLINHFGGNDYSVPVGVANSAREQRLIETIGKDAAAALMSVFGGARLYIPRCTAALTELRNMQFAHEVQAMMFAEDVSQTAAIQTLAPKFGFTERWAYHILKNTAKNPQQRLF